MAAFAHLGSLRCLKQPDWLLEPFARSCHVHQWVLQSGITRKSGPTKQFAYGGRNGFGSQASFFEIDFGGIAFVRDQSSTGCGSVVSRMLARGELGGVGLGENRRETFRIPRAQRRLSECA